MNAKLDNGIEISGKNLNDIRRKMNGMLSVNGPQALHATTNSGAEIHVELWENQDYIKAADGRNVKIK